MHGIDEGELEIEPFRLLRQFSTLLLGAPGHYLNGSKIAKRKVPFEGFPGKNLKDV